MKTPLISVIVPLLDSPVVGETVAALARQGVPGPRTELLVVGRDGCGALPEDSPLRFLDTGEPRPPSQARNLGVAQARGEVFLFTDADCLPQPGWVTRLAEALADSPVAGGAVTFSHSSNRWALADNIASFHELLADRPAETDSRRPLGSLNLGVRRQAFWQVGPFDESLTTSEDFDWVLRARARGLATAFVPQALVHHAAVRSSASALKAHARWYGANFHDFRRRHPGVLAAGPTWQSRRRLAAAVPLKAVTSALAIFLKHPGLRGCWRALPGVVLFKLHWYRAVLEKWPDPDSDGRAGEGDPAALPNEPVRPP